MKKIYFLLTVLASTFVHAQTNLITNGTFDNSGSGWSTFIAKSDSTGSITITGGNASLTSANHAGNNWDNFGFYQAVTLSPGTYVVDLDISFNGIDDSWGELLIGNLEPVNNKDYKVGASGENEVAALGWIEEIFNTWDCSNGIQNNPDITSTGISNDGSVQLASEYVGQAAHTGGSCDASAVSGSLNFEITTAGTYYIVFKAGNWEGSFGSNGIVIDNVTLYNTSNPSSTWTGNTNTDWATAGNWDNGVPTSTYNVSIPDVTNAPIIDGSTNATVNDLRITEPNGLNINSGGSLIVNGTSTGNVTYIRNLPTTNWYLVSAPVSGQLGNDAYVTANDIAFGTGNNRGIANYQTATNDWGYLQATGVGTFANGIGYSIKRASVGDISFTGTINTADVSVAAANTGTGFNLIGNPFTSHVNSGTFLTANSANLVSQTIWVWNQGTSNYETYITGDAFILAPTQGFFVRSSNGTNLTFAEANQASTGGTFQKTSKTALKLMMNDGSADRFARIIYDDNVTTGFDNGFDGETFGGIANTVDVFTHLVANSEGKKFQVQSLPNSDFENTVVPVGVKAAAGKEITFSLEAVNIPDGINVYLEDKATNTVTLLSQANATYKVTLSESLDGIGRFYLHTKASGVLGTETVDFENVSVYATNNNTLKVVGIPSGNSSIKLFNILGKQVMQTSFSSTGVQDISLPKLATGMYIIQLETASGKLNKKIVLE